MLTAIALTPSAPVLLPELAGAAAQEVAEFRTAALGAAAALPKRWIALGVGRRTQMIEAQTRGTFAGYGADVVVSLCPQAPPAMTELPLCALFAGWLRGQVNPEGSVQVQVLQQDLDAAAAVAAGRDLRAAIDNPADDNAAEPIGVLIVADGANTLTASAPGGHQPESEAVQAALDRALASADTAALTELPDSVVGRVAYQALAGLASGDRWEATQLACGAPYGVGYFVGRWLP